MNKDAFKKQLAVAIAILGWVLAALQFVYQNVDSLAGLLQ